MEIQYTARYIKDYSDIKDKRAKKDTDRVENLIRSASNFIELNRVLDIKKYDPGLGGYRIHYSGKPEWRIRFDLIDSNDKRNKTIQLQIVLPRERYEKYAHTKINESILDRNLKLVISERQLKLLKGIIEEGKDANSKKVEQLRKKEQEEYDNVDPNDKVKRKEIYDKYDKLITPLLKEVKGDVDELKTVEKDVVGSGSFHYVYPSKSNPNVVYKVGAEPTVKAWYEIFKEHPDLFPKVYKIGKINRPLDYASKKKKTFSDFYVMVEKLNTKMFIDYWLKFRMYCNLLEINLDTIIVFFYERQEHIRDLLKIMKDNDDDVYYKFLEFMNLIDSVYELKASADLHKYQFGYDTNGVLKCLDI